MPNLAAKSRHYFYSVSRPDSLFLLQIKNPGKPGFFICSELNNIFSFRGG